METFWQRKSAEWRDGQFATLAAIETRQGANQLYFDEGFRILERAGKAHNLWLTQPQDEKRKLLNLLQSNYPFDGVSLTATYRKPFCWLAEGSLNDNWLPDPDECENFLEIIPFSLPGPWLTRRGHFCESPRLFRRAPSSRLWSSEDCLMRKWLTTVQRSANGTGSAERGSHS